MTASLELCASNVKPYRCFVVLMLQYLFDNLKWLISVSKALYGTKTGVYRRVCQFSVSISATMFVTVI